MVLGGGSGVQGLPEGDAIAAQLAAQDAARKAMDHGMRNVDVFVKGPGAGREAALRALQAAGLGVNLIRDVSPIPHNGCRPPNVVGLTGEVIDSGRYVGPDCRLCRREGMQLYLKGDRCYTDKCAIERRHYPPGQHGQRRSKLSDYGASSVRSKR